MTKQKPAPKTKRKPDGFPYVMTFKDGDDVDGAEKMTFTIYAYTMEEAILAGVKVYESITRRPFDKAETSHEIFMCH